MSSTQFMHYRQYVSDSVVDSRGGATVAILPVDGTNEALVSVAHCNPADVFSRQRGRAIAEGRINAFLDGRTSLEGRVKTVAVIDLLRLKETVSEALESEMDARELY